MMTLFFEKDHYPHTVVVPSLLIATTSRQWDYQVLSKRNRMKNVHMQVTMSLS